MVFSDFLDFWMVVFNALLINPLFIFAMYAFVGLFLIKLFNMFLYK